VLAATVFFEITVFEIAMVDSLRFAVEKKQILTFSQVNRWGFFTPKRNKCA